MADTAHEEFVQRATQRIRQLFDIATQVTTNIQLDPEHKYLVINILSQAFTGHWDDEDIVEKATTYMQDRLAAAQELADVIGEPDLVLMCLEVMFYRGPKAE